MTVDGTKERPAAIGEPVCVAQVGPVWKMGGEMCGCVLPAAHLENPLSDHECSCGAWWVRNASS